MIGWLKRKEAPAETVCGDTRMLEAMRLWMRLYMGKAPWISEDMAQLNLAPLIASEVARMATVEMVSRVVSVDGNAGRADYLNGQYQRVVDGMRVLCEYAAAGGNLALKPYLDGGELRIDAVRAGLFVPTAFDASGRATGCLFIDRENVSGNRYTRIETHSLTDEGVLIENIVYKQSPGVGGWGKPVALSTVPKWAGLAPSTLLDGVREPVFVLLKMPFANSVDPESPLGVSIYSRAIGLMREADRQFARLIWEMESGERALYVDLRAFEDGDRLPQRRLYRTLDVDPQSDTLFEAWSPPLREASQLGALDGILQRIEDACGLARGTFSKAPETAARTATELRMLKQRSFATVRDIQRSIETALRELLRVMDLWATRCGLAPEGAWDVTFSFDDSIVADRQVEFEERMRLVELGAIAPHEMRAWYLGESDAVARAMMDGDGDEGTGNAQGLCP